MRAAKKRKERGPIEVVENKGIKIPVYRSDAFGRESYLITYYSQGRRIRERAGNTLAQACEHAKAKIEELASGAAHIGTLTVTQTAVVTAALEALRPVGIPLSTVAREYAQAMKLLDGKGTILDAVNVFLSHQASVTLPSISFSELAKKFNERNEQKGYSTEYQDDCRKHLAILARSLGSRKIAHIKQPDIEMVLQAATGKASARRFNNLRCTVSAMFSFARRSGYLPRDKEHEASLVEVRDDRGSGAIDIYTPTELETILRNIMPKMVPWVALSGLAGLRTSEVHRVTWEMINFEQKVIILEKAFTKTKRRRVIPMNDSLFAWLKPLAKQKKGRLHDCSLGHFEYLTRTAWEKMVDKNGKQLVERKFNALRHSYGTYRFAILQDENKVSAEMGNSPTELREHYAELATPTTAKMWFAIRPQKTRKSRSRE